MTITNSHLLVQAILPPLQGAAGVWTKNHVLIIHYHKNIRVQAIYTVLAHLCKPLARPPCSLSPSQKARGPFTDLFHELGHIVDGVVDHDPQGTRLVVFPYFLPRVLLLLAFAGCGRFLLLRFGHLYSYSSANLDHVRERATPFY